MKASIIIRTKNEEKRIGGVLKLLSIQTEKDFEVIIVDSGSNDKTLDKARKFIKQLDLKIHNIPPKDFTYPYACNFGAKKSSGDYLVFLSGHSLPINKYWLENGLKNFTNKNIAGVYGNVKASVDASLTERIFYFFCRLFGSRKIITKKKLGVLGSTNSIIVKELWQKRPFNEKFILGGEDTEWANYYLGNGYVIIRDPKFSVYHSHGLGFFQFINQYKLWRKTYNQI